MAKKTCLVCINCKKRYSSHYCVAEDDMQKLGVQNLAFDSQDCSLFEEAV